MKFKFYLAVVTLLFFSSVLLADSTPAPISLFGSKPIQLSVGPEGIKQNKKPGFICNIVANISGAKYSDWGETEKDARIIVKKECDKQSGLLLCKEDKITCVEDK